MTDMVDGLKGALFVAREAALAEPLRPHTSGASRVRVEALTPASSTGFNDALRDELAGLKTYLTETNDRLEKITTERSRRSTARSRSSMGSSIASSALSSQRSHITATNRSHLKSSRLTARSQMSMVPDIEEHRTEVRDPLIEDLRV